MMTHYPLRIRYCLTLALCALLLCAAALTAAVLGPQAALAQDDAGAATATEPATTAAVTATLETAADPAAADGAVVAVTANEVNDVARQLWCPLCSGVRLDACELKACAQMKDVIGEKLAGGEDAASIKNYFVTQYGPQVLGEPPLEGFNWLAWILPVLAMVVGGLFILSRVRNGARRSEDTVVAPAPPAAAGDAYSRKLDEELKHYE